MSLLFRGSAESEEGDPERGCATLTRAAQAAEAAGAGLFRAYTIGTLALVSAKAGRLDEASTLVDEALGAARQTGEHFYDAEIHRLEGEFLLLAETPDREVRAELCFHRAIGIATAQGALSWKLRTVNSLARLYVRQLRAADAHQIVADTYAAFREGFETPDLCDARELLKSAFVQRA
jgi:predicted ATPase